VRFGEVGFRRGGRARPRARCGALKLTLATVDPRSVLGDLADILFLTGLGRDRGPSLGTICTVHVVGATVGCILAFVLPVAAWPLAVGMAAAALLVAFLRSAPAALAAALVEVTTFCSVGFLLWFQRTYA
jgi:hypothetical protein